MTQRALKTNLSPTNVQQLLSKANDNVKQALDTEPRFFYQVGHETTYRISANSFRGNYSFLEVGVRQVFKGGNYSREETIQRRKLLLFYFFVRIHDLNTSRMHTKIARKRDRK